MPDSLTIPRGPHRAWHFEIRPRAPYDLHLTAGFYVRFPTAEYIITAARLRIGPWGSA